VGDLIGACLPFLKGKAHTQRERGMKAKSQAHTHARRPMPHLGRLLQEVLPPGVRQGVRSDQRLRPKVGLRYLGFPAQQQAAGSVLQHHRIAAGHRQPQAQLSLNGISRHHLQCRLTAYSARMFGSGLGGGVVLEHHIEISALHGQPPPLADCSNSPVLY